MYRQAAALSIAVMVSLPASGHHGFGRFDRTREVDLEGIVTGIDFVNPHAYFYFDAIGPDGEVQPMRCEMRAATVLRRSGWSPEMFVKGAPVVVHGRPHRDDPASCYVETLTIGDAPTLERYEQLDEQLSSERPVRSLRRTTGEPNLAGDWAQEQYLIARPPEGRGGLVPKSMVAAVEAGELAFEDAPNAGWGARPVEFTAAGQSAAEAARKRSPQDSPRARCEITSILFDWVFDGPINRITQSEEAIVIEYGRGLTRTIHMNSEGHPNDLAASRAGHSIGRWEGDTLVVDTVGFLPGILAGNVMNSRELHVVERFTLDPETFALRRNYVAEDPVYYTDQYIGSDTVMPADAPFAVDPCEELTYIDFSQAADQ
jgi:hypothetical protein